MALTGPLWVCATASYGTSSASLTLTTGNDAGTQAVLDSMAELFPYEFPPN